MSPLTGSGTLRYSAVPPNSLQTTLRTLQGFRCIDLARLEDVEILAQPGPPARAGFARVGVESNPQLFWEEIGLAENAVRSDLLTSREAWLTYPLRFRKLHWVLPEALLQQNRELSGNTEAIHF